MKIRPILVGVVGCFLALATANHVSAQAAGNDGLAKVLRIGGDARYFLPGDSHPYKLKEGMIVKPGTTIQTASGPGNYVDLGLNNAHAVEAPEASPSEISHYQPKAEQDALRLKENTVLVIDKMTINQTGAEVVSDTELDLKAGTILGTVKKLSPLSKYEVKIPNGVAGIRGTIYELNASGILRVLSGMVLVSYVGSDNNVVTQQVAAGQQLDMNTGMITPISTTEIHNMILDTIGFRFFVNQSTTYIAPDHRIYFISTGQGGNGQGQNGNGQGGNGQGGNGQGSLDGSVQGVTITGP